MLDSRVVCQTVGHGATRVLTVADQQHRVRGRLLRVACVAPSAPTQREDERGRPETGEVDGEEQDALNVEGHRDEEHTAHDPACQRAVPLRQTRAGSRDERVCDTDERPRVGVPLEDEYRGPDWR